LVNVFRVALALQGDLLDLDLPALFLASNLQGRSQDTHFFLSSSITDGDTAFATGEQDFVEICHHC